MVEKLTAYLANFNITFGIENEPMLTHFSDIIYPAFQKERELIRKVRKSDEYYLKNCSVKKYPRKDENGNVNDEYVLVGRIIRYTEIESKSKRAENGEIIDVENVYDTSPYSLFIIFLRNHRMVLVKNENRSPDIRSFNATVKYILSEYISNVNRDIGLHNQKNPEEIRDYYPAAEVHVANIPLKKSVEDYFKNVAEISNLTIKVFPLNGDFVHDMLGSMRESIDIVETKKANIIYDSPKSVEGVKKILTESKSGGHIEYRMKSKDKKGNKQTLTNDDFGRMWDINISNQNEDLDKKFDEIFKTVNDEVELNHVDKESASIYQKMINLFKKLI
jgi:hypothetical protein